MKILHQFFILAAVLSLSVCQECIGSNCEGFNEASEEVRTIVEDSEIQIRKWFWYYLRGSVTLYQAVVITQDQIYMFFIHRNIVGTFQTLASYDLNTREQSIKNLVRLGNGAVPDVKNPNEAPL